jgi:hypothetical protein
VDPEFPGNGDWSCPTAGFTAAGDPTPFLESPWGVPLVLSVRPEGYPPWVASFAGGGEMKFRGVFGVPSPSHFLVVVDGSAMLVDADPGPPSRMPVVATMITQVMAVGMSQSLVVLASFTSVSAIDKPGSTD